VSTSASPATTQQSIVSRSREALVAARREEFAVLALLAVAMVIASVIVLRQGAGLTFYNDEWDWVMNRRDWSPATFLEPHNEHLSLVPVFIFKLLFATAGLDAYWVYRATLLLLHLLCAGLLFALVRRRSGATLALISALVLLFLGQAWQDILWPFQLGYLVSIAAGLGMMLALDRGSLRTDAFACALLAVSLASASIGIPFGVVALVELVTRRVRPRRLWVVAGPIALYGLWFLVYGDLTAAPGTEAGLGPLLRETVPAAPAYVANAAAGAIGAVIGLGVEWGRPLAVLGLLAVAIRLGGARPVSPRLAALLSGALVYWGLTALFRAQLNAPTDSPYLYFGAVLVLLIGCELVGRATLTRTTYVFLGVLLLGSAIANYAALREGARALKDTSSYVASELGALEVAGPATDPSYEPDLSRAPDLVAGKYFASIGQYGSPADSPEEIRRRGEPQREAADGVLMQALGVALRPVNSIPARGARPQIDAAVSGRVTIRPGCVIFRPTGPGAFIEVTVSAPGASVTSEGDAAVEVRLRQFAVMFPPTGLGAVTPRSTAVIRLPALRGTLPWHLRLTPSVPVTACGLPSS
jgi:hypothetical protein